MFFTEQNKLLINRRKCYIKQFTCSKKYDFPQKFTFGGSEVLDIKKEHIILGVVVQSDLKWQSQCQEMVRRPTSTTWAIRRMKALELHQDMFTPLQTNTRRVAQGTRYTEIQARTRTY